MPPEPKNLEKFPVLIEKGYSEASVELVTKNRDRIPVECRASNVTTRKMEIEKMVVSERPVQWDRHCY